MSTDRRQTREADGPRLDGKARPLNDWRLTLGASLSREGVQTTGGQNADKTARWGESRGKRCPTEEPPTPANLQAVHAPSGTAVVSQRPATMFAGALQPMRWRWVRKRLPATGAKPTRPPRPPSAIAHTLTCAGPDCNTASDIAKRALGGTCECALTFQATHQPTPESATKRMLDSTFALAPDARANPNHPPISPLRHPRATPASTSSLQHARTHRSRCGPARPARPLCQASSATPVLSVRSDPGSRLRGVMKKADSLGGLTPVALATAPVPASIHSSPNRTKSHLSPCGA